MTKLTFDEALQAINEERQIDASDVLASALKRYVWRNSNGMAGYMPNTIGYSRTKEDAVQTCVDIAGDDAPRGFVRELRRTESADAHGETYEIERCQLRDCLG